MGAISIGEKTEQTLCVLLEGYSWIQCMLHLTTHVYINSNELIVICSNKLAAHCIISVDMSSADSEYRVTCLGKATHLNDKKFGSGTVFSLHIHISPCSSGCWALFLRQRKKLKLSYILFLFPLNLRSLKGRNLYYRLCARLAPFQIFSTSRDLI